MSAKLSQKMNTWHYKKENETFGFYASAQEKEKYKIWWGIQRDAKMVVLISWTKICYPMPNIILVCLTISICNIYWSQKVQTTTKGKS